MSSEKTKCIITSASNKFFPSLINMLGSMEINFPQHPDVYVYDLGLFYTLRKELGSIPWVHVLDIPHFAPHWRACYTWKTYILNNPLADLNFYMDAGCEVLRPLDPLFEKIDNNGYIAVSQGKEVTMKDVTPMSYFKMYELDEKFKDAEIIAAGLFGFKKDSIATTVTQKLYEAGVKGLCLGYSIKDQWKNKGVNKTDVVPDCTIFRHDTTMISVILYKYVPNLIIEPIESFSGSLVGKEYGQYLWNYRLNFSKLKLTNTTLLHKKFSLFASINRIFIKIFLVLKAINRMIKRLP
ncbi:MAG: hypothetical protein WCG97_01640 [bacterium]